jgi:16S rRNA (guanine527-N7)-methyltransferase
VPESASAEPPEAAPADLGSTFPGAEEVARDYAQLLVEEAIPWGLLGPREAEVVWSRHILNCGVVGTLVPPGAAIVDVGSGAGLPGIPLALACPTSPVTLVEPLLRRATWLTQTVATLGLADRVVVVRGRIEEQQGRIRGDVVTARAVSRLGQLTQWLAPAVHPDGAILALRGGRADEEIAESARTLRELGGLAEVLTCGQGIVAEPTTVVRIRFPGVAPGPPRSGQGQPARRRSQRRGGA